MSLGCLAATPLRSLQSSLQPKPRPTGGAGGSKTRVRRRSAFRGVCWHVRSQRWMASFNIHGTQKHLGYFADEREVCATPTEGMHTRAYSAATWHTRAQGREPQPLPPPSLPYRCLPFPVNTHSRPGEPLLPSAEAVSLSLPATGTPATFGGAPGRPSLPPQPLPGQP